MSYRSPFEPYAVASGCLLLLGVADYVTGDEILFHLFYAIPIAVAAWRCRRWFCHVVAVLCAVGWLVSDYTGGDKYAWWGVRYWNFLMFLGMNFLLAHLLVRLREALTRAKELAVAKDAAYLELQEATRKLRELDGSFQTVCAWTKQIKDGEKWVSLEDFLSAHLHMRLSHGIAPSMVSEVLAQDRLILQAEMKYPNAKD